MHGAVIMDVSAKLKGCLTEEGNKVDADITYKINDLVAWLHQESVI